MTYPELEALPVGSTIVVERGEFKGRWLKLQLDEACHISSALQSSRRPYWACVEDGRVRHGSWLSED